MSSQNQVHQISGLRKRRDEESVNEYLYRTICESRCLVVNQNCKNSYLHPVNFETDISGDFILDMNFVSNVNVW